MHSILINARQLHAHLNDPKWVVIDCRFDLALPDAGQQAYAEEHITKIISAVFLQTLEQKMEEVGKSVQAVVTEARTIEQRLAKSDWLVGEACSAADIMIYPGIQLLMRALERREAQEIRSRLLPLEENFPAIARWFGRIAALPGYENTYPPHWRDVRAVS